MAPEQLAGDRATERADVYALGLVLYEVFTGRQMFPAHSFDDRLRFGCDAPTNTSLRTADLLENLPGRRYGRRNSTPTFRNCLEVQMAVSTISVGMVRHRFGET